MIRDTRYIIKRVIIGVLISLILSFIYACDVKAESISDAMITTNNIFSTNNSNWYEMYYNGYFSLTANQNLYLDIQATISPSGYDSNSTTLAENMYGRVTICGEGNFSNGTNISGAKNLTFINTKIPCHFSGSTYIGKVTFATFEFNSVISNPLGLFGQAKFRSISSTYSSVQFIATEFSFNMFPLYEDNSEIFNSLDSILSNIIAIQGLLNTIDNNNTIRATNIINTINGSTNSIINTIDLKSQAIVNALQSGNQAIIDNQNQNTQESITSQQVCQDYNKNVIEIDNRYLNNIGSVSTNNDFGISKYIKINKYSKITFKSRTNQGDYACFYNVDKELISCIKQNQLVEGQIVQIPNNSIYFRFSVYKPSNIPTYNICSNGNQSLNDTQEQTNNLISSDDVSDPDDSLNSMSSQIATNSVISDLLLLPITLFTNVLNAVNGTCNTFNLGSLYGTNLSLPCINLQNILGSSLYGVIDILLCGIFVLSMRKKFVDIFEDITKLKDGGNQLE